MKNKLLPIIILLLLLPTACTNNRGNTSGIDGTPSISLPDLPTPTVATPVPASELKRNCDPGPLPDFSKLNKEQISFPKQFCDWKQTEEDGTKHTYTAPQNNQFRHFFATVNLLNADSRSDPDSVLLKTDIDNSAWYADQIYCVHKYSSDARAGAVWTHCLSYLADGSIFLTVAATDRNGFYVPDEVAGGLAVEFYKAIGQESLK